MINFDEEKSKMIKRETELIEEINELKSTLQARDEFKIVQPPPDPTLSVLLFCNHIIL